MRYVFGSVLAINGLHLRRSGKCDPYLATALPYSDLSGEDQRNAIQIWMQSIFAVTPVTKKPAKNETREHRNDRHQLWPGKARGRCALPRRSFRSLAIVVLGLAFAYLTSVLGLVSVCEILVKNLLHTK